MDQQRANDIYWVTVAGKYEFSCAFPDGPEYERLKRERVKIDSRYSELKGTNSFSEALRIATTEWLIDNDNDNLMYCDSCEKKTQHISTAEFCGECYC